MEPGNSSESLIFQAVSGVEGIAAMPPKGQPRLTDGEIAFLKAWIDQGARAPVEETTKVAVKGANHWAFQPVVRPGGPRRWSIKPWVRNPIDAFILARLERQSLQASPPKPTA